MNTVPKGDRDIKRRQANVARPGRAARAKGFFKVVKNPFPGPQR